MIRILFLLGMLSAFPLCAWAQLSDFDTNNGLNITTSGAAGATSNGSTGFPTGNSFGVFSNGYRVNNGTGTITTGVLNTTALTNPVFSFRLASLSGSSANGADGGDFVRVALSTDGGTTFSDEMQINGNTNARWTYTGGTGTATMAYDGNNVAQTFASGGGGVRTTDGFSTVVLTGLPNAANVVIRLTLTNNATNEFWVVDNLLVGTAVQFASPVYTVNESAGTLNATVCIAIANPTANSTAVDVVLTGGTAVNGTDISNYTTQTVTFPANTTANQCITFTIIDDAVQEGNETLFFSLQNATNNAVVGSPSSTTLTITDNDIANIVITEIMYDPCSGSASFWPNEGDGEFVEIYNNDATAVDISAWEVTDNDAGSFSFIFPGAAGSNTTTIAPGEYIVIARQVVYLALDGNGDGLIDVGNPGAGSKIFNEDILETPSAGGDLNNPTDDIAIINPIGVVVDVVMYMDASPWPTCAGSNDGISLSLLNPNLDNSLASSWFPSLIGGGPSASGGGTPGASNTGGACIEDNVSTTVTQSGCGTANPITTVDVTFNTAFSAVSSYDIYKDGVFLNTYNAGSTASGTYTYTTPNLAPITASSATFEVRANGAPANSCYTADGAINIPGCALPITLLSFHVKAVKNQVELSWQTASEKDNAYMAVERSKNGVHFVEIHREKGHGTTTQTHNYGFTDTSPLPGTSYYRLRQVDLDGRLEYHKIVSVMFEGKVQGNTFQIYPTKVMEELTILLLPSAEVRPLKVMDVTGRILQQITVAANVEQQFLNVNQLPQGAYFISLQSREGLQTLRFIKL